jgi:hypothetical protein
MADEVKKRQFKGEPEFSKAHRLLPVFCGFTDIDLSTVLMDDLVNGTIEPYTTYTEYRIRPTKIVALFELKQENSAELKTALQFKYGNSVWAQWIMAQRLGCRLFIVTFRGVKKGPPHSFYEVFFSDTEGGICKFVGVLDYTELTKQDQITSFWRKLNLITESELSGHIQRMKVKQNDLVDYYEADIAVNMKEGIPEARKFQRFNSLEEAENCYEQYIKEFAPKINKPTIVSIRSYKGQDATMIKNVLM